MSKNKYNFLFIVPLLYGVILVLTAILQHFYQFHNDFWDVFFIARTMSAAVKESWFNPQYPIGSTLFLKLISGNSSPLIPAIISNIVFGVGIVLFSGIYFSKLLEHKLLPIVLMSIIALYPTLFHYLNVGGGDPGAVLFFTIGSFVVIHAIYTNKKSYLSYIVGGLLMGVGSLFRYHVLPGSVLFLLALAIIYRQYWKQLFTTAVCIGIAYSPQIIINLITGHKPLETQFGPMNVYDLMYHISWYQTITLDMPKSVIAIIMQNPLLFVKNYLLALLSFFPGYIPPILAAIIVKRGPEKTLSIALAVFSILFFGLFSATTSGRQILLVLPIAVLCLGLIVEQVILDIQNRTFFSLKISPVSIYLLLCLLISALAYKDIKKTVARINDQKANSKLEKALLDSGCHSVQQVFSTDFTYYIQSLYPHITHFNGGAPRWGTYNFNKEYPEFPVTTEGEFVNACKNRGVSFVILTDNCNLLSNALYDIYTVKQPDSLMSLLYSDKSRKLFKVN